MPRSVIHSRFRATVRRYIARLHTHSGVGVADWLAFEVVQVRATCLECARVHQVVVLAAPAVESRLCRWLCAAGHNAAGWADSPLAEVGPDVVGASGPPRLRAVRDQASLVTFFSTPEETERHVTTDVLARLPVASLWVQLGPASLTWGREAEARAQSIQVRYLHAPYLHDPAHADRPHTAVYGPRQAVTGQDKAGTLLRAVSQRPEWKGPLGTAAPPGDSAGAVAV